MSWSGARVIACHEGVGMLKFCVHLHGGPTCAWCSIAFRSHSRNASQKVCQCILAHPMRGFSGATEAHPDFSASCQIWYRNLDTARNLFWQFTRRPSSIKIFLHCFLRRWPWQVTLAASGIFTETKSYAEESMSF
jgi:hypothetical protein